MGIEFYRVWVSTDTYLWVGTINSIVFTARNDEMLAHLCLTFGYGIPVDENITAFSIDEFLKFAKDHSALSIVENWEDVLPKPAS